MIRFFQTTTNKGTAKRTIPSQIEMLKGKMLYLRCICNERDQIFIFLKPLIIKYFVDACPHARSRVYPLGIHIRDCTIPPITGKITTQIF